MRFAVKILIISAEVWRSDTNGGNVLSNIFSNIEAEFAQIYCNPGNPSNNLCKKYYQMTDEMIIRNILKGEVIGKIINFSDYPQDLTEEQEAEKENKQFYSFFRKHNFQIFYIIKELLWKTSKWKNQKLINFIEEFEPDIVFAPCYGSHIMLSIDRYVARLTNKPVISYISDDHYSLKQFRISPLYWINRFVLRHNLRKTFPYYKLTYTMTDEQLSECRKVFNSKMKILRKGTDAKNLPNKKGINHPIKLIYAGGVYCGRWKTLVNIAKALKKINSDGIKMVLYIYTGNELTKSQSQILNDGVNSFVHGLISQEDLKSEYTKSDIALHVESFDFKNRLATRLSFSTKITDCLSSGCAVMAICWNGHAGYKYLEREDAAICIDDPSKIDEKLEHIVENPNIIEIYSKKALEICRKNHDDLEVKRMLQSDFQKICRGKV